MQIAFKINYPRCFFLCNVYSQFVAFYSLQFEHNKKDLSVVDVVVDPYIAKVLRPHQREGLTFLYECVMGLRSFVGNGAILA